ncbi:MAG TPA: tetratricopeptide repeat protein [Balneolales bacterium]|nr:tetratricopeptide repeat protein [Balneolales bacterium]
MNYEMQDFRKDVIEASESIPVVLDFWAEWCGPCRILGPVLEKLAGEASGKWKLVKIDTEQNPQLAAQFGIRGIPSVKMVYQKKIIAEFQGAQPEPAVRKWLAQNLPESENETESKEQLEQLLASGDRKRARKLVENAVKNDPGDLESVVKLAMLLLPGDIESAGKLLGKAEENTKFEIERETLQAVEHLKDLQNGKTQITSTVDGLAEKYKEAAKSLFKEDFQEALEQFLDCLIRDRTMDEDGPRKACIAIFTMLGNPHPLTQQYRRRFSMALY